MSVAYQFADVVVATILAVVALAVFGTLAPSTALTMAVLSACTYYFSRNPWGSPDGDAFNERIDALYDRVLPF